LVSSTVSATSPHARDARLRKLQALGILCGFAAGAWLGAAEAPTKLVTAGISPVLISLMMVIGVFLARWTLPALIQGTSYVRADVRKAPHLMLWAVIAGCMWAVANTLTIFAIRDIGLSIAFPLWNANSLLGIVWGALLFNELRGAGSRRWMGVLGGAVAMFAGAVLLALASSTQAAPGHAWSGVLAALGAGALWGTMYIPYRKAYLTGMNPLSFVTFFTFGELGTMGTLALVYAHGASSLWQQLSAARGVLFWLLIGGFIWVIGDLFQQYAAKYVGISRGIPLSNTNQLWGLLWGTLVFGELHSASGSTLTQVIGGSLLMAAGAGAIALSTATSGEHNSWQKAAQRESERYGVDPDYVRARMFGEEHEPAAPGQKRRTWVDWTLVAIASLVLIWFASLARVPHLAVSWGWMCALVVATFVLLVACATALWRVTRFT
jgi:drug/metabolite transporter (DMT)-like permease